MNLSALDRVGDFLRAQLLTVFDAYREALQEVVDSTAGKDELTNAFVKKKLARFEELKDQWCKHISDGEQDQRQAARNKRKWKIRSGRQKIN